MTVIEFNLNSLHGQLDAWRNSHVRADIGRDMELLYFFEWMEASLLGTVGKTYGGVYAIAQSLHLMSLVVLGGAVIVTALRLMNILLKDVPSEIVVCEAHRWFKLALISVIITGVFMAAAVALRLYYNQFFWVKMLSLFAGILFVFLIQRPLLNSAPHSEISPVAVKLVAIASLVLWFTVAATGRWIGFS